ncbi:MAG: ribonuclease HII [Firmicutes bacterium]|nr:ribonuclease HII [Bacillota bacterium]
MAVKNTTKYYQDNQDILPSFENAALKYAGDSVMSKWIKSEEARLSAMFSTECELHKKGIKLVAGVDEVGRGPMAGPVVACAAVFSKFCFLPGLNDSKKLSETEREFISSAIRKNALSYALGIVDSEEIDRYNIHNASLLAMERAVEGLSVKPGFLLVDGKFRVDTLPIEQLACIGGDAAVYSISAASIVAKVHRDNMMKELDKTYPGYGLAEHKGYCTADHMKALEKLGVTAIHRKSYKPVRDMLAKGKNHFEQIQVNLD